MTAKKQTTAKAPTTAKTATPKEKVEVNAEAKYLLENTAEHQIDLNYIDADNNPATLTVPRATFDDAAKKVNGWVPIDGAVLEKLRDNKVIASYFDEGTLLDSGVIDGEVEEAAE